MEAVKKIRMLKKITQAELGKRSGIARQTINTIENGKSTPTTRTLQKIAKALGVKVSDLLEEN